MIEKGETETVVSSVKTQVLASLIVNCVVLSHGINAGFLSPALPLLLSPNTPLTTGPLTANEISWLGAISSIGSMIGSLIYGMLAMWLGPKQSSVFLAFPPLAFWLLVMFGDTFHHMLIARLISGLLGGGLYSCIVVFIAEISNDNIRGRLGSIMSLARNVGQLMGYSIGVIVEYKHWPYIFIWIPVIYLMLLLPLTNTPQYYIQIGNYLKAKQAIMFYKRWNPSDHHQNILLESEFNRLKSIDEERKKAPKIQLNDFKNRMALKGFTMSLAVTWFLQMTGCYTFTNYASYIFEKSGGTIFHTSVSSIILAIVQIIGGLVSTQMGDAFGRKTTLAISLCGSVIGLISFAGYLFMRHMQYDVTHFIWLPLTALSLIIFITSAGIMALSNTCAIENFPTKIRTVGIVWFAFCNNGVSFVIDKCFPVLIEVISLQGVLLVLASTSFVGLIFFLLFMTETKGQPLDVVNSEKCDRPNHTVSKIESTNKS